MNHIMATGSRERGSILLRLLAASCVVLTLCACQIPRTKAVVGDPDAPAARMADSAVTIFHDTFNRRQYQTICQAADRDAFRAITALSCADFLAYVHERLGPVQESKRSQLPLLEDARASTPVRVQIRYTTRFERDTGTETFVWRVAAENATLISYNVAADGLGGNAGAK